MIWFGLIIGLKSVSDSQTEVIETFISVFSEAFIGKIFADPLEFLITDFDGNGFLTLIMIIIYNILNLGI
jgi:hypothetical protein